MLVLLEVSTPFRHQRAYPWQGALRGPGPAAFSEQQQYGAHLLSRTNVSYSITYPGSPLSVPRHNTWRRGRVTS